MPSTIALTWRSLGAEAMRKTSARASRSLTSRATMSWAILSAAALAAVRAMAMDDSVAVTGLLVWVKCSMPLFGSAGHAGDDQDDAGNECQDPEREDAELEDAVTPRPGEPRR